MLLRRAGHRRHGRALRGADQPSTACGCLQSRADEACQRQSLGWAHASLNDRRSKHALGVANVGDGILEFNSVCTQRFEDSQLRGEDAGGGKRGVGKRVRPRRFLVCPGQRRKPVRCGRQKFLLQRGKEFLGRAEELRYVWPRTGSKGIAQRRQPGIALTGERQRKGLGAQARGQRRQRRRDVKNRHLHYSPKVWATS